MKSIKLLYSLYIIVIVFVTYHNWKNNTLLIIFNKLRNADFLIIVLEEVFIFGLNYLRTEENILLFILHA